MFTWLALFYFSAVAAVNDGRPASGGAGESLAAALRKCGYDISYEVSLEGPGGLRLIDFVSAASVSAKNRLHVASVNDPSKFDSGVGFGDGLATVSEAARAKGAVLAVNGGYFAVSGEKVYSVGKVCENHAVYPRYVRHDRYPYFYIGPDGSPAIAGAAEFGKKIMENGIFGSDVRDFMQTKPMLVYNSSIPASLMASEAANDSRNPRTAIAVTPDNRVLCIVVEGRRELVEGMSQTALAGLLIKLGASRAVNCDGGGSSTIFFNGCVMNRPSGGLSPFTLPGVERPVHSIVYFRIKK